MKNILLIVAHPKTDSFSFAMANTFKEENEKNGHHVELVDLYREKNQQGFFTYDKLSKLDTPEMRYYQEKIKNSDELVFVFPYWWGSYPAILHNFIDWNFSAGFAFKYENSLPIGLLHGKTATVFTTTGAPKLLYAFTGANKRIQKSFKEQFLDFCGIKLNSFNIYGGLDTSGKDTKQILKSVKAIAKRC